MGTAAEADLKAHVDAQPSVELLETTASSGSAKCKAAKSEAYQQCRDHQNAAYFSCESMYKNGCGAACASPTGSGSGMGIVASPMQFQEASVVHTTTVAAADKVAPKKAATKASTQ